MSIVLERIPVVAGVAFREAVARQPSRFTATLTPEPGHKYFLRAIAVSASGETLGYVAPEVARQYFAPLSSAGPVTCPARRAAATDRETSGVELLLDFTSIGLVPSD